MTEPQQRTIEISRCYDCPNLVKDIRCKLTEQFIVDATKIPASCTLPRSRPATSQDKDIPPAICQMLIEKAAAQAREPLELLKKKVAWGKEIDKNHLFDYHNIEQMIEEAEQRIESLRSTPGGERR